MAAVRPGREEHEPARASRRPELLAAAWPFGLLAVLALAALVLVYAVAVGTASGLSLDTSSIVRLDPATEPRAFEATSALLRSIDVGSLALLGGAIVAFALLRGQTGQAVAAVAVIGGANVTTQVLKPLLGRVDPVAGEPARALDAAFPSGHATVAMSLGLALLLVAPPALRALAAALGAAYAAAVGVALLALAWHYPSDVAGGYLVATAWVAAAAGALRAAAARRMRRPPRPRRRRVDPAVIVIGAAVLALAFLALATVVVLRRPDLLDLVRLHTRFFFAAAAVAALSAALVAAAAAAVQRYLPRPPAG